LGKYLLGGIMTQENKELLLRDLCSRLPIINESPNMEDIKKFRKATCNGMMNSKAILQRFNTLEEALDKYKELGGIVYNKLKRN
jgi:hypothetical protein